MDELVFQTQQKKSHFHVFKLDSPNRCLPLQKQEVVILRSVPLSSNMDILVNECLAEVSWSNCWPSMMADMTTAQYGMQALKTYFQNFHYVWQILYHLLSKVPGHKMFFSSIQFTAFTSVKCWAHVST